MRNFFFILIVMIISIPGKAQSFESNSSFSEDKGHLSYFAANFNVLAVWNTPLLITNTEIEYNINRFGFSMGPIVSHKMEINPSIVGMLPETLTIPGFAGGCKFLILDPSKHYKTNIFLNLRGGIVKYNDKGISDMRNGGNWIDGHYHNTFYIGFAGIHAGLSHRIYKNLHFSYQAGIAQVTNKVKLDYVSYKHKYTQQFRPLSVQIGLTYKFLGKTKTS